MNQQQEIWVPANGLPLFEVSNIGNVRSWRPNRSGIAPTKPHPIKIHTKANGYKFIHYQMAGKKTKNVHLHSLVLISFTGPRPAGMDCCHLNHNKEDNRLENLAWGTRKQNMWQSINDGLYSTKGEKNPRAKLTDIDVLKIIEFDKSLPRNGRKHDFAKSAIINKYCAENKFCRATYDNIVGRRSWKHVSVIENRIEVGDQCKKSFYRLLA